MKKEHEKKKKTVLEQLRQKARYQEINEELFVEAFKNYEDTGDMKHLMKKSVTDVLGIFDKQTIQRTLED